MQSDSEAKVHHGATVVNDHSYPPPPYSGPPVGPPPPHIAHGPVYGVAVGPTMVPAVVFTTPVGADPSALVCRSCNQHIVTRVEHKPTTRTHLLAALLCLLGCWPCVCVPYCMDSCQNSDHYCPNCGAYIGSYQS